MVKKSMVEELIVEGSQLLQALDKDGFPVEAMFWIDEPDDDRSRLVIASPEVAEKGSTDGYRRIQKLLLDLNFSGLELEDVHLADPDSRRFTSMLSLAERSPKILAKPSWIRKAEAVVYRWPSTLRARVTPPLTKDEVDQAWAVRPMQFLGNPTVLVDVDGDELTVRAHPNDKPPADWDRPRMKAAIEYAIRLRWPDREITWLD